jgi:hypothetical protein
MQSCSTLKSYQNTNLEGQSKRNNNILTGTGVGIRTTDFPITKHKITTRQQSLIVMQQGEGEEHTTNVEALLLRILEAPSSKPRPGDRLCWLGFCGFSQCLQEAP